MDQNYEYENYVSKLCDVHAIDSRLKINLHNFLKLTIYGFTPVCFVETHDAKKKTTTVIGCFPCQSDAVLGNSWPTKAAN